MEIERRGEILGMVRDQLKRTNPPSTEALYGRAARIDESIRKHTRRQFHARFPLRVHRERAREQKKLEAAPRAISETSDPPHRDLDSEAQVALRQLFHEVARDVVGLSSGPELFDWAEDQLESYVDQVADALNRDGATGR